MADAEVFTVRIPTSGSREETLRELRRCLGLWFADMEIDVAD